MSDKMSVEEPVVRVPVALVRAFAQAIARHDLWDGVEAHLKQNGAAHILMSRPALAQISGFMDERLKLGAVPGDPVALRCACHTPAAGGTPVSYPTGGGDAGAPDGGTG